MPKLILFNTLSDNTYNVIYFNIYLNNKKYN